MNLDTENHIPILNTTAIRTANRFEKEITAEVTITNTGQKAGKEVVQFYLTAPNKLCDKPALELKGFVKTKTLNPGESQIVTLKLNQDDLASFVENKSAWIAESGSYTIKIGASSKDIRATASFEITEEITVEKVHDSFHLDNILNETHSN